MIGNSLHMNRSRYIFFNISSFLLAWLTAIAMAELHVSSPIADKVMSAFGAIILAILLTTTAFRLRDIKMNPMLTLIAIIPFVNILFILYISAKPSVVASTIQTKCRRDSYCRNYTSDLLTMEKSLERYRFDQPNMIPPQQRQ